MARPTQAEDAAATPSQAPKHTRKSRKSRLSVAIYPLSLGGSNGERLEIEAMWGPPYNAASQGLSLTTSPHQADVILLYGSLTEKLAPLVYRLLVSLPPDLKLIAVGSETLSTSPFRLAYGVVGPILEPASDVLPAQEGEASPFAPLITKNIGLPLPAGLHLAGYIAGSPPDPQAILNGILQIMTT